MGQAASILDSLDSIGTQTGADWLSQAVESVRQIVGSLSPEIQQGALQVAELLWQHKNELSQVAGGAYTRVVASLSLGNEEAARRIWLATVADFDEQSAELDAASAAARKETVDRESDWQTVRSVSLEILNIMGHAAIPLLLAAIPL